ncbi:MAG: hypothetical protein ACPLZH_01380 [Minisyncoccales bacterium]
MKKIIFFLFCFFSFSFLFSAQKDVFISQEVFYCGDGICQSDDGENSLNCPQDCLAPEQKLINPGIVPPSFTLSQTAFPTFSPTVSFPVPSPLILSPPPPPLSPLPSPPIILPPLPVIPGPEISPGLTPSLEITPLPSPSLPSIISPSPLSLFIEPFRETVKKVAKEGARGIIYVGSLAYLFSSLLGLIPQAKTLQDLIFLPMRILSLFFFTKKEYWGVVYDSLTKQPLDPAIVILKDKNGKKLKTQITDIYGRYSFLVKEGAYYLEVKKTNYSFPSLFLKDKKKDEIYDRIYHGELIVVSKPTPLTFNIPLDPVGLDWNQVAKKKYAKFNYQIELLKKHFPTLIFYFGFILSFLFWYFDPTSFNRNILVFYLILFFLRILGFKPREYGFILRKENKKPLPFSLITVFFEGMEYPIKKIMTDESGRYHLLVEKGTYNLKIAEKKGAEEFQELAFIKKIRAKEGIIKKDFKV